MNTSTLRKHQEVLADNAYVSYNFGDDAEIIGFENWTVATFDGKDDWAKNVYLKFEDQDDMAPCIKISFHAAFSEGTLVLDKAYAYDVVTGSKLGSNRA